MKRLFVTCLIMLWVLSPEIILAQDTSDAGRKRVRSLTYLVPEDASDWLTSNEAFAPFAARVRADLEGILRDKDFQDRATLKGIETTLMHLDFQQGKLNSALGRVKRIRELEEMPEAQLYDHDLFVVETIIKARQKSGATSGTVYQQAVREAATEILNRLPGSMYAKMKRQKLRFEEWRNDSNPDDFKNLMSLMRENGMTIHGLMAQNIISSRTMHRFLTPVAAEMVQAIEAYLAAHKPPASR